MFIPEICITDPLCIVQEYIYTKRVEYRVYCYRCIIDGFGQLSPV